MAQHPHTWRIRPTGANFSPSDEYGDGNTRFITLKFVHGGKFTPLPTRHYNNPHVSYVDFVDVNNLSIDTFQQILEEIGYEEEGYFFWKTPKEGFAYGLCRLVTFSEFHDLYFHIYTSNFTEVAQIFCETGESTVLESYPYSLLSAPPAHISKMLFKFVYQFPDCTSEDCKNFILGEHGVTIGDHLVKPAFWLALRDVRAVKSDFKSVK